MDLARFQALQQTPDGRKIVTLMADPSMTDALGNPAGFLSLVDKGANLRRFQVVKAEGEPEPAGLAPQAWLAKFLVAVGAPGLAAKFSNGDAPAPMTFDAAITAERLRRARWEATDALWEVIGNVMASDLPDKPGAVALALGQFASVVMELVTASATMKAEDHHMIRAALEPPELTAKAGRVISARNRATIVSARDALAAASTALEDLIKISAPATASKADLATASLEDPDMLTPAQITELATAAASAAITAAKSAGITAPAELAQIGATATAEVFKAAVMGPKQAAMPADVLASQIAASQGMSGMAPDPLKAISQALRSVTSLATKIEEIGATVTKLDAAINGSGEGETREPGMLEIATKSAELANAVAVKVAKIEGTPTAPRGAGDPPNPPGKVTKAAGDGDDSKTWDDSALSFNN